MRTKANCYLIHHLFDIVDRRGSLTRIRNFNKKSALMPNLSCCLLLQFLTGKHSNVLASEDIL